MTSKKSKLLVLLAICIGSFSISGQTVKDTSAADEEETAMQEIEGDNMHVSLVNLIANPEKYNGKTIQVVGYLNLEFEGDAIYLHKEDYVHGLTTNGFWVRFSDKISKRADLNKYSKKYVIIIGTFDMNRHGHMGLFAGELKNIRRLDTWD